MALYPHPEFTGYSDFQDYEQQPENLVDPFSSNLAELAPESFESFLDNVTDLNDTELPKGFGSNTFGWIETPAPGPPSGITASSESASDSFSNLESESLYSLPQESYSDIYADYSSPAELEIFQNLDVDPFSRDYSAQAAWAAQFQHLQLSGTVNPTQILQVPRPDGPEASYEPRRTHSDYDPAQFNHAGFLESIDLASSTPLRSSPRTRPAVSYDRRGTRSEYDPVQPNNASDFDLASFTLARSLLPVSRTAASRKRRGPYSDYVPATRASGNTTSTDYCPLFGEALVQLLDLPLQLLPAPIVPSAHDMREADESLAGDSKKTHRCPVCSRVFDRSWNLKSHVATHDRHHPKPHVCPHRSCGRAFRRKHDLKRHRDSIHQDGSVSSSHRSKLSSRSIGGCCDACGKSLSGSIRDCTCVVK